MNFPLRPLQTRLTPVLCVLFAIALQIQDSFHVRENYAGIRLNLADLLLPFAGCLMALTLLSKTSLWPQWLIRYGNLWPILMTAVFTFALLNGYYTAHEFSHWALFNKYVGWLALMAYFFLGAWIATNQGDGTVRLFLTAFVTVFIIITIANLTWLIARDLTMHPFSRYNAIALKGLMGNRNAFAFALVIVLSLLLAFRMQGRDLIPPVFCGAFFFLLPAVMTYNGSRASVLSIFLILTTAAAWQVRKIWRPVLLPLAAGFAVVAMMFLINHDLVMRENQSLATHYLLKTAQSGALTAETYDHVTDTPVDAYRHAKDMPTSDIVRLRVFEDAIKLWKQSPVQGIGLGGFIRFQLFHHPGKDASQVILDSTPLWLLVETGLIGLAVFLGFAIFTLQALWRNSRFITTNGDALRYALLLTVFGFTIMGLFHELLYTRIFWMLLGLGLAVPVGRLEKSNPSS